MLRISITENGKSNKPIETFSPLKNIDIKEDKRLVSIFDKMNKNPNKYRVTLSSSFDWNERCRKLMSQVVELSCKVLDKEVDYPLVIGFICSISDHEGYLQEIEEGEKS